MGRAAEREGRSSAWVLSRHSSRGSERKPSGLTETRHYLPPGQGKGELLSPRGRVLSLSPCSPG